MDNTLSAFFPKIPDEIIEKEIYPLLDVKTRESFGKTSRKYRDLVQNEKEKMIEDIMYVSRLIPGDSTVCEKLKSEIEYIEQNEKRAIISTISPQLKQKIIKMMKHIISHHDNFISREYERDHSKINVFDLFISNINSIVEKYINTSTWKLKLSEFGLSNDEIMNIGFTKNDIRSIYDGYILGQLESEKSSPRDLLQKLSLSDVKFIYGSRNVFDPEAWWYLGKDRCTIGENIFYR